MYHNSIGVIYELGKLLNQGAEPLVDLGVDCVQLVCWNQKLLTKENAKKVLELMNGRIRIGSFWAGWSGPKVWDNVDGPHTLGIVPSAYRSKRIEELLCGADFTHALGVKDMATHIGFIPEQPSHPDYREVVVAVKYLADYCKERAIYFNFETGQETPTTLMRLIQDAEKDNLGINLDPANLILYGKGNPVDAIDLFKGRIRGVHVKDGEYPCGDLYKLGKERVVGEGAVNFPVFLSKLLSQGYQGDFYIEREISGEQQMIDIKKTLIYIKEKMNNR